MKKQLKGLWQDLVDIKDVVIIHIMAFFKITEYRHKVIKAFILFLAAFTVIAEITIIAKHGKLPIIAFIGVAVILTVALGVVIDYIKEVNAK